MKTPRTQSIELEDVMSKIVFPKSSKWIGISFAIAILTGLIVTCLNGCLHREAPHPIVVGTVNFDPFPPTRGYARLCRYLDWPSTDRALPMWIQNQKGSRKPMWGFVLLNNIQDVSYVKEKLGMKFEGSVRVLDQMYVPGTPAIYINNETFWDTQKMMYLPTIPDKFLVVVDLEGWSPKKKDE